MLTGALRRSEYSDGRVISAAAVAGGTGCLKTFARLPTRSKYRAASNNIVARGGSNLGLVFFLLATDGNHALGSAGAISVGPI